MLKSLLVTIAAAVTVVFVALLFYSRPQPSALPPAKTSVSTPVPRTPVSFAPQPLRVSPAPRPIRPLKAEGILACTNEQRRLQKLPELRFNPLLMEAARQKVSDMFDREYFEHTSPVGVAVGEAVRRLGYPFLIVGENLALGNFADDCELVKHWMESPGHRANIVRPQFSEIGIAAGEDEFNGRRVWLAVQIFAAPVSACPQVDPALLPEIAVNEQVLNQSQVRLDQLEREAGQARRRRDETYNQYLEEYDLLVADHNRLVQINREFVEAYNGQVRERERCLREMTQEPRAPVEETVPAAP